MVSLFMCVSVEGVVYTPTNILRTSLLKFFYCLFSEVRLCYQVEVVRELFGEGHLWHCNAIYRPRRKEFTQSFLFGGGSKTVMTINLGPCTYYTY